MKTSVNERHIGPEQPTHFYWFRANFINGSRSQNFKSITMRRLDQQLTKKVIGPIKLHHIMAARQLAWIRNEEFTSLSTYTYALFLGRLWIWKELIKFWKGRDMVMISERTRSGTFRPMIVLRVGNNTVPISVWRVESMRSTECRLFSRSSPCTVANVWKAVRWWSQV